MFIGHNGLLVRGTVVLVVVMRGCEGFSGHQSSLKLRQQLCQIAKPFSIITNSIISIDNDNVTYQYGKDEFNLYSIFQDSSGLANIVTEFPSSYARRGPEKFPRVEFI